MGASFEGSLRSGGVFEGSSTAGSFLSGEAGNSTMADSELVLDGRKYRYFSKEGAVLARSEVCVCVCVT